MLGAFLPTPDAGFAKPATPECRSRGEHLLGFELRGDLYALPASSVTHVFPMPELFTLPLSPSWLAGIVSCRGEPAAVLDLSELLTGDRSSPVPDSRLALLKASPGDVPWAFFAQEIREFSLPSSLASQINRPGLHLFHTSSVGDLQIKVLDPDAILSSLNIT